VYPPCASAHHEPGHNKQLKPAFCTGGRLSLAMPSAKSRMAPVLQPFPQTYLIETGGVSPDLVSHAHSDSLS